MTKIRAGDHTTRTREEISRRILGGAFPNWSEKVESEISPHVIAPRLLAVFVGRLSTLTWSKLLRKRIRACRSQGRINNTQIADSYG